jgi:hypothetical protein
MDILGIAKVCHEANKALCETFGDFSQTSWIVAEDWQKDSAKKGVEYFIANPEASGSAQHDAWMKDKFEDGWTFGVEKDATDKRHPYLVPFEDLSPEQQAKDVLFRAVCSSLLPLI